MGEKPGRGYRSALRVGDADDRRLSNRCGLHAELLRVRNQDRGHALRDESRRRAHLSKRLGSVP